MTTDHKNVGGLSPSQEEMAVRLAELLAATIVPATAMQFLREVDDSLGDAGMAEILRLMQATWLEDCDFTEVVTPMPTDDEIRERVKAYLEENLEVRFREEIAAEYGTQLKRETVCDECGKVRRGRDWIVTAPGRFHCNTLCPTCKARCASHRTKRKSARAATLNIATEVDSEAASGLPDV